MGRKEAHPQEPPIQENKDFNVGSIHFDDLLKAGDLIPTSYAKGSVMQQDVEKLLRDEKFDVLGKGTDGNFYYIRMPDEYQHEISAEGSHSFYVGKRDRTPLLLVFHTREDVAALRNVGVNELIVTKSRK